MLLANVAHIAVQVEEPACGGECRAPASSDRIQLTNADRLFFVQLHRWFPLGTWRPCPTSAGSQPPTTLSASPTLRFARPSAKNFRSTSTTRSSASEPSSRTASQITGRWDAIGAPPVGERTEKELLTAFCDKIAELRPVSRENGSIASFAPSRRVKFTSRADVRPMPAGARRS